MRISNRPPLLKTQVHLWSATLDISTVEAKDLEHLLSEDEVVRAARYRFERDRRRFIAARGLLRRLLASYSGTGPRSLAFSYNRYGKPAILPSSESDVLCFNLSHAANRALFAVSWNRQVGVDIEYHRSEVDCAALSERFFSSDERAALKALPAEKQRDAFFRCWTRKEAYIKATSEGMSLPLDSFSVSLRPGEPAALLGVRNDPREHMRWAMLDVSPGEQWSAALVAEGHDWDVCRLQMFPSP